MKLTIVAIDRSGAIVPPRTKKNSAQMIPNLKRPLLVPSKAYREWERAALRSLVASGLIVKRGDGYSVQSVAPIGYPVNCRALIYRDALRGDAVGFYQAIGDFLQEAGIVTNDRFIVSWDGTRLLKDKARPRVELELEHVSDSVQGELFSSEES